MFKPQISPVKILRTVFAAMICVAFTPALVSCGEDDDKTDEPSIEKPVTPAPDDEDHVTLELTIKSGTCYDGTSLFEYDSQYRSLKIILEQTGVNGSIVSGKYTEKYGSTINGTGTFTLNESTNVLTINADTYMTGDWGEVYNVSTNESAKTITLSPKGWDKQKFIFAYKEI